MEKPYKYFIMNDKTKEIEQYTNIEPLLHRLETWESTENAGEKIKKQTKTCYIDTRYKAKLRLYNYITYKKNGLEIPKYQPFKGTEIGKTIPILNF